MRGCRIPCPSTMRGPEGASQCRLGGPPQPLCCSVFRSRGHQSRALWQETGRGHQAAGTRGAPRGGTPSLHACLLSPTQLCLSSLARRREEPAGEERRRPDTLQLWQERERRQQQQQSAVWGAPRKDRCAQGSPHELLCLLGLAELGTADPTSPSFSSFLKLGVRAAGGGPAASSTQAAFKYVSWTPRPSVPALRAHPCPGHPSDSPLCLHSGTSRSNTTQLGASGGQGAPTPTPAPASTSQEPPLPSGPGGRGALGGGWGPV